MSPSNSHVLALCPVGEVLCIDPCTETHQDGFVALPSRALSEPDMRTPSPRRPIRQRAGTLLREGEHRDGSPRYRFRLRLADGSKSERYDVPAGMAEKEARKFVVTIQKREDKDHLIYEKKVAAARAHAEKRGQAYPGETADAWHARFLKTRGEGPRADSGYRWRKWIHPHIGSKPMADISKDDVEVIRDTLDTAIAALLKDGRGAGRINAKTALNIWATLTTAFKYACQAKQKDLRVRTDNPCLGVLAPEKGDSRRKAYIYPKEFLLLAACKAVPLEWRELYTIACYLYLRPGELIELRWGDVDLEMGHVAVTRALDWTSKEVKPPKTRNGIRNVPIPATLMPLLVRMKEGKKDEEKVVPILEQTGKDHSAEMLRDHLKTAKVTHARLTADTSTHMPINFRSWRDTGITWLAMSNVDVGKMQRRAGHDSLETTMGYVKVAEDLTGAAGVPFPELPEALIGLVCRDVRPGLGEPADATSQGPESAQSPAADPLWTSQWTGPYAFLGKMAAEAVPAQGFEPR